jgi:RNA polymerase sigma-70 factor (sigma-E family)
VARRDAEFAEYFAANFDGARRIGYALCGDWVEAEELAQAAFVRVYARWSAVHMATAGAYLRTVVTRLFLDSRRRGRARERSTAELPELPVEAPLGRVEERMVLVAALQAVSPRQRAVLVLRFLQDMSIEQVAEVMNCSAGTVKSQTARGLEALRGDYLARGGVVRGQVLDMRAG